MQAGSAICASAAGPWPSGSARAPAAGAEAGDGRDESNRSLQERLADAKTGGTAAESEAKQAELRAKHLAKQAAEQRKSLASKDKEAREWQKQLAAATKTVQQSGAELQVGRSRHKRGCATSAAAMALARCMHCRPCS
jgi:hypothetical protein